MKCIAYTRADGGMSVVYPAPSFMARLMEAAGLDEEQALEFIREKDVPSGTPSAIIDHAELPTSRAFRNAWRHDGKAVAVDMAAAREIKLAAIRKERDGRLLATDGIYMRAMERNEAGLEALKVKRQALRDIPQTVDLEAAKTPEALEALQPTWPE